MTSKSTPTPNRIFLYHNDGTGRDCYISSNNGGFYKEYRISEDNSVMEMEETFTFSSRTPEIST